jgi:hypothetical protein
MVFWVMTQCNDVVDYKRFGGVFQGEVNGVREWG